MHKLYSPETHLGIIKLFCLIIYDVEFSNPVAQPKNDGSCEKAFATIKSLKSSGFAISYAP